MNNDVIYRFSSQENKLMFKTFPEKFVPQYGGYCALAISEGFTADINPLSWFINEDKLFLFFDNGAKDDFKQDANLISKANNYWLNK